ncbi:A/G-specific adenine glycosylase [Candidatus Thorarchaeota archaeon]|nr:MAG: A/G-specific adenine glycosylase [Candidatus Thorarchaeota archaeon]
MIDIEPQVICDFQQKIMDWWKTNRRELPWRVNHSLYSVLVSEFMLQQTQVNRVVPKYLEFMEAFPSIESLAAADTKSVLQVWSGLGYNRRALWLKEAAQAIVEREEFPGTVDELRELRGIGPYTSRSILIFAFNKDLAAVDTNIRRVLIASGFADESMSKTELQEAAECLLLRGRARDWHNALMDYGSQVLTSSSTGIRPTSCQDDFDGSSRQLRGAIVRVLTEAEELALEDLMSQLDCSGRTIEDVTCIITRLVEEGLVEQTPMNRFRIPFK